MAGFLSLVRRLYLSVYNWTVFAGWVQVLYLVLKTLKESGHEHVYNAAEKPLLFAQTAAFLEILHSLVGLVRSPVSATLPQISSRLFLLWGILWSFPETQTHILVTSLLLSWSITEIVRYAFFGLKEALGFAPSWLLWLRYSSFLVLYVTGISSEVGLIYIALPFIKFGLVEKERAASSFTKIAFCITLAVITIASEKYCVRMPNKWNFSFDYFYTAVVVLGIYVPGSPHMYTYMLAQRQKALSKSKRE